MCSFSHITVPANSHHATETLQRWSNLLGGSWDVVNEAISTLIGAISIVSLFTTLVSKSHDAPKYPTLASLENRIELRIYLTAYSTLCLSENPINSAFLSFTGHELSGIV